MSQHVVVFLYVSTEYTQTFAFQNINIGVDVFLIMSSRRNPVERGVVMQDKA
jgi:hypothetical protein